MSGVTKIRMEVHFIVIIRIHNECMYVHMYIYLEGKYTYTHVIDIHRYVCKYVRMCTRTYVCMYVRTQTCHPEVTIKQSLRDTYQCCGNGS